MAATDGRRHRPFLGCIVVGLAVLLAAAAPARADRASGTWTGTAEARGNYYWEESTRVVAPTVSADLEGPSGAQLHGDYLVDSITSASVGAGNRADVAFTEVRHEIGLGAGYELSLDEDTQLQINGSFRASKEPDYRSLGGGLAAALSLNQRSTVLRLSLFSLKDQVAQLIRGAGGVGGSLSNRGVVGYLHSVVVSAIWEQVLSPVMTAQVGYDFGYLRGYLQNPYRLVPVQGLLTPQQENHPDQRFRHTLYGRLAYYVRTTGTSLNLIYRAYLDSWDISAINPEGRIYQEIGPFNVLRVRYRFYTQTRAFFQKPPSDYSEQSQYITADPKMTEFHSHELGFQLLTELGFLEGGFLDFARRATIDMSFDYIWNTNRYGNGVIAQLGLRLPF